MENFHIPYTPNYQWFTAACLFEIMNINQHLYSPSSDTHKFHCDPPNCVRMYKHRFIEFQYIVGSNS